MNPLPQAAYEMYVVALYETVLQIADPRLQAALNCGLGYSTEDCLREIGNALRSNDSRYTSSVVQRVKRLMMIVQESSHGSLPYSALVDACSGIITLFPSD